MVVDDACICQLARQSHSTIFVFFLCQFLVISMAGRNRRNRTTMKIKFIPSEYILQVRCIGMQSILLT